VRELENVLERAIVLGGRDLISLRDLSAEPRRLRARRLRIFAGPSVGSSVST